MSWFDKLFGENNHSDSDVFFRKTRRQHSKHQLNSEDSLLPENNDIYERPKGKFRFPMNISDNEVQDDISSTDNVNERNNNRRRQTYQSDFTTGQAHTHRRRHRNYTGSGQRATSSHDDRHKEQSHADSQSRLKKQASAYATQQTSPHSHYSSTKPRFKLQSERIKSSANEAKPTYQAHSFKASEVPSAIFGTKKRRPIENGIIPDVEHDKRDDESRNNDKQQTEVKRDTQQPVQSTQAENTNQQSQHNDETTHRDDIIKKRQPARNNTINIENIYASQIVEEIRKERERKVLQKRRFKKALQDKRQQKQHQDDDIQKAIDAMYAKQAERYTGESSLNDDTSLKDNNRQAEHTSEDTHNDNNDEKRDYHYEEIALDDIQQIQELTDDQVNVSDITDISAGKSSNNIQQSDDQETLEAKQHKNMLDREQHSDKHQDDHLIDNDITDAEYHKIEQADISTKTADDNNTRSNSDNRESSTIKQGHAYRNHESHNDIDSKQSAQHSATKLQQKKSATNKEHNHDTTYAVKAQNKNNIKLGSKPFNVVMTPSDRKRMMDQQAKRREKQVNVPELTPETSQTLDKNNVAKNHESNHNVIERNTDELSQDIYPQNEDLEDDSTNIQANVNATQPDGEIKQSKNDNNNITAKPEQTMIRRGPNIKLPDLDILNDAQPQEIDETWIDSKKQELNDAFYYFNVPAEVKNVTVGPSVTRFELAVEKGVKVSRITALQDDIKMALAAKDIRIEAPIPGTSLVGIEVPNQNPTKVNLKSILETEHFKHSESKLTVAMGNRINNEPLLMDIAKTPHALIAGATGSGKSVCINSILMSLLYKNHSEELRLLLIDPKMVELAPYNDLPHLVSPVITDVKAATQSLKWAVEEMERRYKLFAQYHVRNITAFNKKASYEQRIPKIVIVIDELADLMMIAPQEVEQSIARIAQKARACGIHMLVATQRPSVNVITGLIKANIPTRIAFMVSSSVDSRTIIDSGGAERLLGYGDMLYLGSGMNKPIRVQGTFVSDDEIDGVVDFIKHQREPDYLFEEKELLKKNQSQAQDELFEDVCEFMIKEGHISTSLIQRHFQIGYNRAARIIDQLEQLGYITGANGSKPRDVLITEADITNN